MFHVKKGQGSEVINCMGSVVVALVEIFFVDEFVVCFLAQSTDLNNT